MRAAALKTLAELTDRYVTHDVPPSARLRLATLHNHMIDRVTATMSSLAVSHCVCTTSIRDLSASRRLDRFEDTSEAASKRPSRWFGLTTNPRQFRLFVQIAKHPMRRCNATNERTGFASDCGWHIQFQAAQPSLPETRSPCSIDIQKVAIGLSRQPFP